MQCNIVGLIVVSRKQFNSSSSMYHLYNPIVINWLSTPINFTVVNQYYEAEVVSEYVIKGNTAVLKCNIPSFVGDFVKVEAWVGSDGTEFLPTASLGI